MLYKYCGKCKKLLPIIEFYKNKRLKYGFNHYCKECERERLKLYFKPKPKKEINKNLIIGLFEIGLNANQISKKINISYSKVARVIKKEVKSGI